MLLLSSCFYSCSLIYLSFSVVLIRRFYFNMKKCDRMRFEFESMTDFIHSTTSHVQNMSLSTYWRFFGFKLIHHLPIHSYVHLLRMRSFWQSANCFMIVMTSLLFLHIISKKIVWIILYDIILCGEYKSILIASYHRSKRWKVWKENRKNYREKSSV